ncbi:MULTISPECIES: DUF1499 domain-containing protein [Acidiphilium]|jgi:hypothetical protein|uniref:DUF1499 domain-containing protein n=2 Tax=Acidiphilium TaxID=522 RepID=A5FW00_ACICJ|nr:MULTISPECIES: DUF1499 domain-containing protein [Acidiphilium]MBU6356407.1 DUF1499 domain-containing protein [Rhodospirillales bacterium]ABQ29782.1 hypothetical protein Acry_0558 [Acidiphilium cryptum JF-5]EGO96873.1 hypothetical protein APM_0222 [Acidiphilium sp. PM]KDM67608.1 hypothetical protein DUF1499 [Acidiphilium sp. JA12-A1]MBS3024722.1 DUF1499 domain-containing protein [Acidiphilium multivorum]
MAVGILPLLLSLIFPACGKAGAAGVKPPGFVDFTHLTLPSSPNKALAAPAGFIPKPAFDTPRYALPPAALYALVARVAGAEPRTYTLDAFPDRLQQAWVARTPAANFPDVVIAQIRPDPAGGSDLILYSHSIYGYSDFGTNAARLQRWLSAIGRAAEAHP